MSIKRKRVKVKFPTLYKKTSTGADQSWTIETNGNKIITCWGQIGGAIQRTEEVIKEGKNIGHSNETSAVKQAESEAQSRLEKKLKKDYVLTLDAARDGKASAFVEGGLLPMLAKKFSEDGDKIVYPCAAQPKLDGHRCIAVVDNKGKCTLWSRTRKAIKSVPHIVSAVESLKLKSIVLDGELYNTDYRDKFEELTHFIRQSEVKPGHEIVHYHIYDIADNDMMFCKRTAELRSYELKLPLVAVETLTVAGEDELMAAFEKFLAQGYEGAMARNLQSMYVNKRSADLQKIKVFDDSEFKCVAVEEGRGKLAGHAIFVCVTKEGTEFRAKMKGDTSALKQYFDNPKLVVGKMVTVKYQGMTNKAKVPRFPVALRIRQDI